MHEQTSAPNMIEYSKPIQDPRAYTHIHTHVPIPSEIIARANKVGQNGEPVPGRNG